MAVDKEKIHKLQINLSKNVVKQLEELRNRVDASSKSEVIKSSLKLYSFITNEKYKDKDLKIFIKDSKGNIREIII